MSRSIVVGANGFVGSELTAQLVRSGNNPVRIQRSATMQDQQNLRLQNNFIDLTCSDWRTLFQNAEVVYFVAGFAHAEVHDESQLLINSETPAIAFKAANQNSVRKFVWLSSIQVLGNASDQPLNTLMAPNPQNKYAASKLAGEVNLLAAADSAGTELAIVRPPLVYGPGVKGNFLTLLAKVHRGGWLPLGSANATRSMVAVENLCDLMIHLAGYSAPRSDSGASRVWHVCDSDQVTIKSLVQSMKEAFDSRLHLIPVSARVLEWGFRLARQQNLIDRLLKNMEVDQSATCEQLNWQPPVGFSQALIRTVQWYQQQA